MSTQRWFTAIGPGDLIGDVDPEMDLRFEKGAYAKDFVAGIDPFGAWTTDSAQQAEREGVSSRAHQIKQLVGTAGGVVGGATVVPSAIYGAVGAAKGFASGRTMGQRLLGAAVGGLRNAQAPLKGVYQGVRATAALRNAAKKGGGTLSSGSSDAVRGIIRKAPLGSVEGDLRGNLGRAVGEARKHSDRHISGLENQTADEVSGAIRSVPDRLRSPSGRADIKNILPGASRDLPEAAGLKAGVVVGDRARSARDQALNSAEAKARSALSQLDSGSPLQLTREQATALEDSVRRGTAEGVGQLALGGGVGGTGAFVQYGKGRKTEQDFQKRLKERKKKVSISKVSEVAYLLEMEKISDYREGGSFTHDGVGYDLDKALAQADRKKVRNFSVDKLKWVLNWDKPTRFKKADLSAPILVARSRDGELTAVDGLNRVAKAVKSGQGTLPGRYLSKRDLEMAKIAETGGHWRKLPSGHEGHDQHGNPQHGRTWVRKNRLKESVKLKPHQESFADAVMADPAKGTIAAHGTGTGKTVSAIAAFERLKGAGKANRALVITPAGLRENFHSSVGRFTDSKSAIVSGAGDKVSPEVEYVVVSYAAFRRDPRAFLAAYQPDMVIADEFHRATNQDSATHKSLEYARSQVPNFMGLTASIVQNDPSDVVPLVQLASGNRAPIKTRKEFSKKHLKQVSTKQKGVFGGKVRERRLTNTLKLYGQVGGHIHYIEDLDATEKPPKEVQDVAVPMSKEQLKLYRMAMKGIDPAIQRKISLGAMLSKQETMHVFTRLMRARQISNAVHTGHPGMSLRESAEATPKIKAVMDDVQTHLNEVPDGKVIIYTNMVKGGVDVISAGLQARGIDFGVFAGRSVKGVTEKSRQKAVEDYQSGKNRVILITGAGAEGLSLGDTTMVALADGHYNPERTNQAMARGIRVGGQSHRKPEDRGVLVKRYVSAIPRSFWQKVTLQDQEEKSVDQWVYSTADRKSRSTRDLRDVLRQRHQHEEKKRDSRLYRWFGGGP